MKPKKYLGQSFLINKTIVDKIVSSVNLFNEVVLEIGPGKGALSSFLVEKAKMVYAFEIDQSLKESLNIIEQKYQNFKVIYKDILKVDLNDFIDEIAVNEVLLIANIPYYITGPLLNKMKDTKGIKKAVLMVQKEVGERLLANVGNKNYGSLTVLFNLHFEIKRVINVKRTNFYPKPKVDSVVLKFIRSNTFIKRVNNLKEFYEFVDAAFKMKRKTLVNNLAHYYQISKEEVTQKIKTVEPDFNLLERAENITLERFIAFSNGWNK